MIGALVLVLGLLLGGSLMLNIVLLEAVKELKEQKKSNRKVVSGIIKATCKMNQELVEAKATIDKLEWQLDSAREYLDDFRNKAIKYKSKCKEWQQSYLHVSGTLCDLIRDKRVIKTKYQDKIFTYDLYKMTVEEKEALFGKQIAI